MSLDEDRESLLSPHGGYRRLKSFRVARLVFDLTVRFCDRYIERGSRTRDQMVQAARSGVQNIAEGSQASATSKKTEIRLTNVARASLEELRLDYEDYLRQRNLERWPSDHPSMIRFKERRCATVEEFRRWIAQEASATGNRVDETAANGILSLLNVCCWLLHRQVQAQVARFEREGGFSERLYHGRTRFRRRE
jgi:four helix bundle suffix protein